MSARMCNRKGLSWVSFLLLLLGASQTMASAYLEQIPGFWRGLYPQGGESLYCGDDFAAYDRRYNIEHVFPMAWVTKALKCGKRKQCRKRSELFNEIEADMHNLYPARKSINKARGALAFGEIRGEKWLEPDCDFELDERARRVEPRPQVRGNIARAMLYMADRYPVRLYPRQRALLLRWHKQDSVDTAERARDAQIRARQGNSNPWITGEAFAK